MEAGEEKKSEFNWRVSPALTGGKKATRQAQATVIRRSKPRPGGWAGRTVAGQSRSAGLVFGQQRAEDLGAVLQPTGAVACQPQAFVLCQDLLHVCVQLAA